MEVSQQPDSPATLDDAISFYSNKYGVSEELARNIMWCESRISPDAVNHNRREDGTVWSSDWGYWQFNDYYWEKRLKELGWDMYIPEQNLEAGFYVLSVEGRKPWVASNNCHRQ